jgi:histidyl-tRNA synthetase
MSRSVIEVDLIGSNTIAADNDEVLCLTEDILSKFGLRSNPEDVHVSKFQKFKRRFTAGLLG